MKKTLIFITITFLIVLSILALFLINIRSNNKVLQQVNEEYEYYLNKEIYGVELATLINKAIDNNKRNEVPKSEKGFYINNGTNSITITIQMMSTKETYHMEQIHNARNRTIC